MARMSRFAVGSLRSGVIALAVFLALAIPCSAANFSVGVLIEAEINNTTGGSIETNLGNTAGTVAFANNVAWNGQGQSDNVTLQYTQSTNTMTVTVVTPGGTTTSTFNPTGGAGNTRPLWTIPANAFFVTATSSANGKSASVTLNNLALSGISGAMNILQPIQQTSLSASNSTGGSTKQAESAPIVFQGDVNGNWKLTGTFIPSGVALPATGTILAFGFSGTASPVPEASSWSMLAGGGALLWILRRRKTVWS
jgi:hypothetical protein